MRAARFGVVIVGWAALAGIGCLHHHNGGGWSVGKPEPAAPTAGPQVNPTPEELPSKPSAALHLSMAEGLEKDETRLADAAFHYEKARQLDPSLNDKAARRLAVIYDRLDQQAAATKEFQELLKKKPKDSALLNDVGYSYYNRGQWAEAETYLRRAVSADKTNKLAWNNLGLALAMQGRYQEGLEAFQKAVSPAEAHLNVGFVLAVQGKNAEAVASYRRALDLEPTLQPAQAALARLEGTRTAPSADPAVRPASGP
jgi:Tfp pilus assembly protein PilF